MSAERPSRDVEADGNTLDDVQDPPAEQSIYIPSGDTQIESYRLSTFEHFPTSCPLNRNELAKEGFYYTGFLDRVKCFSCARTIENWEATDNPADPKWHKTTCPLPQGEECGNIPLSTCFKFVRTLITTIPPVEYLNEVNHNREGPNEPAAVIPIEQPSNRPRTQWTMANVLSPDHKRFLENLQLNRELDRLASFARWSVERPNIAPACLAKSGFFYLGDMTRTQCFSCGGVLREWCSTDDATIEHRKHFPQCRMILNGEPRNEPVVDHHETEEEKNERYPCRLPWNPHMKSKESRLGTFDARWPKDKTNATPVEIAQAGFFFLGEQDRVRCWYCNGGLQDWEHDDVPWKEHAKWFPTCEFLLNFKGQDCVYAHLAENAHLPRPGPTIINQGNSNLNRPLRQGERKTATYHHLPPTQPPIIIDSQEENRKRRERVQKIMEDSEIVQLVLAMGFERSIVATLLEDRIIQNDIYESSATLLDDIFKVQDNLIKQEDDAKGQREAENTSDQTNDEGKCKICLAEPACAAAVPCGHMCACMDCANKVVACPICRAKILHVMRIYPA